MWFLKIKDGPVHLLWLQGSSACKQEPTLAVWDLLEEKNKNRPSRTSGSMMMIYQSMTTAQG